MLYMMFPHNIVFIMLIFFKNIKKYPLCVPVSVCECLLFWPSFHKTTRCVYNILWKGKHQKKLSSPPKFGLPAGNGSPECGAVVAAFGGTVCMEPPHIRQGSPLPGQVRGLTWQGETEPGARAEWQGGMRMQTRARADCHRALRIAF